MWPENTVFDEIKEKILSWRTYQFLDIKNKSKIHNHVWKASYSSMNHEAEHKFSVFSRHIQCFQDSSLQDLQLG